MRMGALLLLSLCVTCIYYFPFSAPPTRASPLGVQLLSTSECGENLVCYHLKIDCEGLEPREAEIRANHVQDSRGAVIFLGGGWGRSWYGDGNEQMVQTIGTMQIEGYETYEVRWLGDNGWGTNNSGRGFKAISCGFAEVARWIVANMSSNPEVVGATGHSGGANQISYGLVCHGLDRIFDVVVLTGGPARTDLVALCLVNWTGVSHLIDYVMGWEENGDYCLRCEFLEWVVEDLEAESIVSPLEGEVRDYNYTNTRVGFVNGELDVMAENGRRFYDAITCEKTWVEISGVGHGVPNHPEGAEKIREMLLEGLEAGAIIPEFPRGQRMGVVTGILTVLLLFHAYKFYKPINSRC